MELTPEAVRVLGCLIEKGATTPDHYPLSTNALINACNQKSNREPIVEFNERVAVDAMLEIRQEGLARTNGSGRSDKHRHILHDALELDTDQQAVLAVMMLRGPQSAGELKTRTERYASTQGNGFSSLDDIEAVLAKLASERDPLVVNVGRGSGQSQDRWAHLLCGSVPDLGHGTSGLTAAVDEEADADRGPTLVQRVEQLEARLAVLEDALGVAAPAPGSDPSEL